MVAGCLFFVIGTGLAVAHEHMQEDQMTLMGRQTTILEEVKELTNEVKELTNKGFSHLDRTIKAANTRDRLRELDVTADVVTTDVSNASNSSENSFEMLRGLATVEGFTPLELALESLNLSDDAGAREAILQRFALESAIAARAEVGVVQRLLEQSQMWALGSPAGETTIPGRSTESDLLHFSVDDSDGHERTYLPLFTRLDAMRSALLRNPEWQSLSVLELNGGDVITHRDPDVALVVNPWSDLEWQLDAVGR